MCNYRQGHTEGNESRHPNSIYRDLLLVHFMPQERKWHSPVSRKSVSHPEESKTKDLEQADLDILGIR